jgi:predicted metal-binding membrane protein
MATSASSPGTRSSPALWAGLLVVAAFAWLLLIRQTLGMPSSMAGPWREFGQFLVLWIVMMAAMMLPSVAPVASMYLTVLRSRAKRTAPAHTAALISGYLLPWSAFGVVAYGISLELGKLVPMNMSVAPSRLAVWSAAITLVVAGLYQFTPLKARCLRQCRSPLGFLLHFESYSGRLRDIRVGVYHGAYCIGCCWSLMVVLVVAGVMNMAWMAGLTAVVFLEKVWRSGKAFGYAFGGVMILAGLLLPWLPPVKAGLLG